MATLCSKCPSLADTHAYRSLSRFCWCLLRWGRSNQLGSNLTCAAACDNTHSFAHKRDNLVDWDCVISSRSSKVLFDVTESRSILIILVVDIVDIVNVSDCVYENIVNPCTLRESSHINHSKQWMNGPPVNGSNWLTGWFDQLGHW